MRLLHVSDLHIGKRVNEFSMFDDQRYILGQIIDVMVERKVDALLIAGDVYDKSAPSSEAVALLDWFLGQVAATGTPVFMTAGNHDSAERVAYASALLARQNVFVSPVYDGTITHVVLSDEHGPVTFWLIPFLKPSAVRPYFPDAQIASYTDALRCAIDACDIDPRVRNVALAHQFVTWSGGEVERSESELSLGGMDNVDASVFDAFDYVALGHVHHPQRVGREEVRYSGSPLKYSFSEIGRPKSMPLVELGAKGAATSQAAGDAKAGGCVAIELVPLVPMHDMRQIKGPLAELTSPDLTSELSEHERRDYLRVILTDEQPPLDAIGKLRAVYPNVMGIEYDNARSRAAGLEGAVAPEQQLANPLELFDEFYQRQNGSPMSEAQTAVVREELNAIEVM